MSVILVTKRKLVVLAVLRVQMVLLKIINVFATVGISVRMATVLNALGVIMVLPAQKVRQQ